MLMLISSTRSRPDWQVFTGGGGGGCKSKFFPSRGWPPKIHFAFNSPAYTLDYSTGREAPRNPNFSESHENTTAEDRTTNTPFQCEMLIFTLFHTKFFFTQSRGAPLSRGALRTCVKCLMVNPALILTPLLIHADDEVFGRPFVESKEDLMSLWLGRYFENSSRGHVVRILWLS